MIQEVSVKWLFVSLLVVTVRDVRTHSPNTAAESSCLECAGATESSSDDATLLQISSNQAVSKHSVRRHRRACGGTTEANVTSLCSFFDSAVSLETTHNHRGWDGFRPPYKIHYSIAPAGKKGLGAFAAQEVQKGDAVYCNHNSGFIVIDEKHMSLVQSIAVEFPIETVERALGWCSEDYVCDTRKSLLCELDDGKFFNHDSNPSTVQCGDDDRCSCATRDLKPGDELTEDYDAEGLDSRDSDRYTYILLQSAYRREARSKTRLCAR